MQMTLDGNGNICRANIPHFHHVVVLEALAARMNVSTARAQVQWTLVAAERHPFGTSIVTFLVCLGEVLNLDNMARHMVRDEVSG